MNAVNQKDEVQNKPVGKRPGCLFYLGRVAIGSAAFLVLVLIAGLIYQSAASASELKKYPPPGELYDVGHYRLHLYCTGNASTNGVAGDASPTVILEAGSGLPGMTWYMVQKQVEGFARVCSYDRAGYGWSDLASNPLTPDQVATDLHKLLEIAHIPGPYILVGHSAGGYYIRAYANQYPSQVSGMILVDAAYEQQDTLYPPEYIKLANQSSAVLPLCQVMAPFGAMRLLKIFNALVPMNSLPGEVEKAFLSTLFRTSYCKSMANETQAITNFRSDSNLPNSLGDLPLTVLSAGISADDEYAQIGGAKSGVSREVYAKVYEANQYMQKELVSLSTLGKQIIATESGHMIHYDQPGLVVEAIDNMLEQVSGK